MHTLSYLRIRVTLIVLLVTAGAVFAQRSAENRDRTFAGAAAWQSDDELGKTWEQITGRFIFQRTCLSCHQQGPASFTKTQWQERLAGFPREGHEPLSKEFGDLTASFAYGRMVPDNASRLQAVRAFLAEFAPSDTSGLSADAVDLLPQVGQKAPDFSITDTEGVNHSLGDYITDQRALILVFSRGHW